MLGADSAAHGMLIAQRSSLNTAPPAPIISRCKHIQSSLIRHIDPQLWERLDTEGVEAQLWAMWVTINEQIVTADSVSRWIRLLFTREVPFGLAMRLWDGIFALDTTLALLDYICVAMLLLIRNERRFIANQSPMRGPESCSD